jgi:hypothetical protein
MNPQAHERRQDSGIAVLAEEDILREMVAIKCQTDPPIDHSRR